MARKCKECKTPIPSVRTCDTFFLKKGYCSIDHMASHGMQKASKAKEKRERKEHKEAKAKHHIDKKRVKPRKKWLDNLQTLVNQYVVHVRDKGKGCCTCGTAKPDIKYDAGHCFTRAARSDLRFELTNLHKQCSVQCNQHKSGAQGVHKEFIANTYGQDQLDKLEDRTAWPSLNEVFPGWEEIEKEMIRYRKILRDNGIKPNV